MLAEKAPSRSERIDQFLTAAGWVGAERHPLAGDASFRRYERIVRGDEQAMLMDAPPPQEDVRPFIHVTELLHAHNLSAPKIFAQDAEEGFLLIEDLGHDLYSAVLRADTSREKALYLAATEVLVHLRQSARPVALQPYDDAVLLREAALVTDWFLPQVVGLERAAALKPEYLDIWKGILAEAELCRDVPVLRDYHADNLMWLPERAGLQRVGLLDYQDALQGDSAYDLVSFLEDIRRDVSAETIAACLEYFMRETGQPREDFMRRYAVLGAQRNCKIVGIFTRLCVRDAKPHYLAFLPRVWQWLEHDLSHPLMAPLKAWMDMHVPSEMRGHYEADRSIGALV